MEYSHSNNQSDLGFSFKTGILINAVFISVEAILGIFSNSMALLSDAGHNLSDLLAMGFSWFAVLISRRKPTTKFTYGFRRSTILIALFNTLFLLVTVGIIIYLNIERFGRKETVNATNVIIVAAAGVFVNAITAWLFNKERRHDLNIKSTFSHFVADALVSAGVVFSGILIAVTGIQWIDMIVSLLIVLIILYIAFHLLIDSVNLALDAVPENIDIEDVRLYLKSLPEVSGIHDLHIWALSTTDSALTVHIATNVQTDYGFLDSIQKQLRERYNIAHSTIQIEYLQPLK